MKVDVSARRGAPYRRTDFLPERDDEPNVCVKRSEAFDDLRGIDVRGFDRFEPEFIRQSRDGRTRRTASAPAGSRRLRYDSGDIVFALGKPLQRGSSERTGCQKD